MRKINNWWMIHCYVSLGVRKESTFGVGIGPQKLSFFRALVGRRRVQHIVDKQIDVEKWYISSLIGINGTVMKGMYLRWAMQHPDKKKLWKVCMLVYITHIYTHYPRSYIAHTSKSTRARLHMFVFSGKPQEWSCGSSSSAGRGDWGSAGKVVVKESLLFVLCFYIYTVVKKNTWRNS